MSLNKWFDKGLTTKEYIETLDQLKDGFEQIDKNFTLPDDDEFFKKVNEKDLKVIVIAEPWCGHCMLNMPILFQLCEEANMPVRISLRDENLELMDQYLTNEKRIIPRFIFINQAGEEVATWGPMAEYTKQFVDNLKEKLPPKDGEDYQEKLQDMYKATGKAFKEDEKFWTEIYNSLKETLNSI